jgi:hypothetical protein
MRIPDLKASVQALNARSKKLEAQKRFRIRSKILNEYEK